MTMKKWSWIFGALAVLSAVLWLARIVPDEGVRAVQLSFFAFVTLAPLGVLHRAWVHGPYGGGGGEN